MHAHDKGNEEARQLIAAVQMLRLATELSTPHKPAPKTDDGQPRPVPAARVQRRQPFGRILEENDRVLRHVGNTFGPPLLAVGDDAGALYPSRQRGAKRDGQALSGELNTRWP